jgi:PHD/YefM family antitoxin component YafN of YafNO toxin-antitoxin module
MPVKVKSSQVQQNFGLVMDRALMEDDVVVERYGMPRVAIVGYGRYQRLVEAEREVLRARLQQASAAASARAAHLTEEEVDELIERARSEVHSGEGDEEASAT